MGIELLEHLLPIFRVVREKVGIKTTKEVVVDHSFELLCTLEHIMVDIQLYKMEILLEKRD
jgi:hypothetical protein